MINIIIPCTPNYENRNIVNTVNKSIDVVSQFIVLYNSIKKNWKSFEYKINLFYNKDYPFSKTDFDRLRKLDIEIFPVDADYGEPTPFMIRCNALSHKLSEVGSHRLCLDPDMLALNEPVFELGCDWQAMFAGKVSAGYDYINKKCNFNLKLENYLIGNGYRSYMGGANYETLFPYFNGGAYLLKETMCGKFCELVMPCYDLCIDKNLPKTLRHLGIQYAISFALIKLSDNWKPFKPGFNYLNKISNLNSFGLDNVSLLHYCGRGGDLKVKNLIEEYRGVLNDCSIETK